MPFSIQGLAANMSAESGREITFVEVDDRLADLRTACGLRARTADATFIVYRRRPTQNQTSHTLLHELSHEWLDHGTNLSPDELRALAPASLHDSLAERMSRGAVVQARARYDSVEEREAELSASLIKELVRGLDPGDGDMVSLLEMSLSHPVAPLRRGK
ncbi:hypothetical protein [Streptomyces sp. CA-111067]|uniref:hypothetical protein n=1 Tax=Streptomyces sp. CA-111067 TaxID=3240046 RepID=UPI003D97F239